MNESLQTPSFEDIARDLSQPLQRYLERYIGDRAVAEDLRQETLMRLDRGLASFEGRSSLKTWAFSIANRVAADYLRDPARRTRIVQLSESDEPIDPDPALDERLVVDEMGACIRGVIDSLPEAFRAALVLHELEGLTAEQTAEVCECTVATAKIRIHRGRVRLRQALAQQCEFYRDAESVFRCDRRS